MKRWMIFLVVLFILGSWMQLRHAHEGTFNWRTAFWADQTGYYIYLPALFIYDFDAQALPENIVERTGQGFSIDTNTGKIQTKYTCGVAILQAPFFLTMHAYHYWKKPYQDGFTGRYHQIPHWAALFYGVLGLFLLYVFLQHYYDPRASMGAVVALFLGTNLSYYTIDHTGMSHVYSFFLFAAFLFFYKKILLHPKRAPLHWWILVSSIAALVVLIRPTNALFIGLILFLEVRSWDALKKRLTLLVHPLPIIAAVGSLVVIWLPQFLYWHYLTGSWMYYSYGNEGFPYWNQPKLWEVWWAPNNGLFSYSPLLLLLPLALWIRRSASVGIWQSGIAFLAVSYWCGAWHIYSFGCGFGARNFVEYTALFALPFAGLFAKAASWKWSRWVLGIFIIGSISITQKLFFTFDKCFFGQDDWDVEEYERLLFRGYYRKGLNAIETTDTYIGTTALHTKELPTGRPFERLWLAAELESPEGPVNWVIETYQGDSLIFWQQQPLSRSVQSQWVYAEFGLPHDAPRDLLWHKVYIWNKDQYPIHLKRGYYSFK